MLQVATKGIANYVYLTNQYPIMPDITVAVKSLSLLFEGSIYRKYRA